MMKLLPRLLVVASALLTLGVIAGCSIDSASDFYRDLSVDFSGFYAGSSGGNLVEHNSGSAIKTLDLRQTGDSLEAVDNNGRIWRGTIGDVSEGSSSISASFTLEGTTTAGAEGTFSGNFSTDATSTTDSNGTTTTTSTSSQGVMQGTYVEAAFFSTFYGVAQNIPGQIKTPTPTNTSTDVSISPTLVTIEDGGADVTFTAKDGDGSYTFKVSDSSLGQIIAQTSDTATYRRLATGDNSITVSSDGKSATATILQPAAGATTVSISPQTFSLTSDGSTKEFTASGGNGTFSFSVGNSGLGIITSIDGAKATYQRTASGDNTLTVTSDGATATATILQP